MHCEAERDKEEFQSQQISVFFLGLVRINETNMQTSSSWSQVKFSNSFVYRLNRMLNEACMSVTRLKATLKSYSLLKLKFRKHH